MRLTTIVCGYNQARHTADCLWSVLRQSPAPDEIIFVDNGSTDETAEVVASISPNIRYIRQANNGPSGARNRGLRESASEFVHFIDADDWIEPGFYAAARDALDRSPDADVLVAGEITVLVDGSVAREADAPSALGDAAGFLFAHHPWCVHAALVRRTKALSVDGFAPELWRCEDWDFWLRLALAGATFVPFPGRFAAYRKLPSSNSSNYDAVYRAMKSVLLRHARRSGSTAHLQAARACLRTCGDIMWHDRLRPALQADLANRDRVAFAARIARALRTDARNLGRVAAFLREKASVRARTLSGKLPS